MPTRRKKVKIDDIVKKTEGHEGDIIIVEDTNLLVAGMAAGATIAATVLGVGLLLFKSHKKKKVDLKKIKVEVMKEMKCASDKVSDHVKKMNWL
jgi:hypothetical protein